MICETRLLTSVIGSCALLLAPAVQAASIIGSIDFSSSPSGEVIFEDSSGNVTGDLAAAVAVRTWVMPQANNSSGSFVSVPSGQSVDFAQPWTFTPSVPTTPLWSISGFGNFSFAAETTVVSFQPTDGSFLFITVTGTLTGDGYSPTPAVWNFTTQGGSTDGKFSWSATTTAVPEPSAAGSLALAASLILLLRRRTSN